MGCCPRSGAAPIACWCGRLLGRLTGGNRYPKELVQYGICGLTSDRYSIVRHGYCAMAVTLQELDLPRLETD